MTHERPLGPSERATDVFDRAATLSFTVVARVRGELTQATLEQALRSLEQRHPLLRSRVARDGKSARFVPAEAEPIPLTVRDGDPGEWRALAEASLAHRIWSDAGPRAELTWLRHDGGRSTLLLCLHHLVSDGSSGVLAMRDLLRFVAEPEANPEVIASPGQHAFYPNGHGGLSWKLDAAKMIARSLLAKKPRRIRAEPAEAKIARTVRIHPIELAASETEALTRRARAGGATVHGVLCAALATGVAACLDGAKIAQRILHPVDLRRYAKAHFPELPTPGDAVGYYVSSVDTDHVVDPSVPLADLAREVTEAVRRKKSEGVPWLTAPIAGPWVTRRAPGAGDLPELRDSLERKLIRNTFALTNLGVLEKLGVRARVGALHVDDLFFVAAGSVFGTIGAAAATLSGKLTVALNWVEPLVSRETGERIAEHLERRIASFGADAQS